MADPHTRQLAPPDSTETDPWRRIVLEAALDGVIGIDENQNILDWNRQAESIFGWSREEALGRQLAEVIIPPQYRSAHAAGMKHYLATGEGPVINRRIEVEGLRRDGSIFPIELTVIPIQIEGKPLFYSFLRDISQRKQVEQGLLQNEEQFRTLAESIPQLAWTARSDGYRTWYNQRWYDYTGTSFQQMEGSGWTQVQHPDHLERVVKSYRQSMQTGRDWECILPLRGKDGEWRWFLVRAIPQRNPAGEIIRWVGTNTDVTEQRQTRENLSFLSEASAILSSSLNYDETLQRVAQVAVPSLGDWCTISVIKEDGPRSIATAHPDPGMLELAEEFRTKYPTNWSADTGIAKVLKTGKSELVPWLTDAALAAIAKDPEHLRLMRALKIRSVMMVPIQGRDQVLGVLALISSRDEKRYSEGDMKIAEELGRRAGLAIDNARLFSKAQEAIRMRDEFLSIASHELKTPLTSLKLQAQMNQRLFEKNGASFNPAAVGKLIKTTTEQVDRLTKLVEDMLDISRITHGKLSIGREEVDLCVLAQDVLERFHEQLLAAGCDYRLNSHGPIIGHWDRYRIEQVLTNLITNAIKYSAGKPIEIEVLAESGQAVMTIKDHGLGIAPENLERIFQRFERVITASNINGLGLGLYISRQIVTAHAGSIEAISELGCGSTFTVRLPLKK